MPNDATRPSRQPWRPEEDAILRARPDATTDELVAVLGRTRSAVVTRRCRLGLSPPAPRWTAAEDALIRAEARRLPTEDLAARLGRSVQAVRARRREIGAGPGKGWVPTDKRKLKPEPPAPKVRPWTAAEDALVIANPGEPSAALAATLGRSVSAVTNRRHILRRQGRLGRLTAPWTTEEETVVRAQPHLSAAEVGRLMGRTTNAVGAFRRRLRGRGG